MTHSIYLWDKFSRGLSGLVVNPKVIGVADLYAIDNFSPSLVFDFSSEFYRTGGSTTTFDAAMTHTRSGNATMVDSQGFLKWAPHNLALNSATPATQSITSPLIIVGAKYTVECTGVSIALSGAGTGTATEGSPVEITASTTTLTLTVTGSTGTMWVYRSDLGGMVDNPDTGNSYVPTTSAARYLPRRGHHIYNGAEWVNEGVLVESEARTNLFTYSNTFTDAYWSKTNSTVMASGVVAPDGTTTASKLEQTAATDLHRVSKQLDFATGQTVTLSVWGKAAELNFLVLRPNTTGTATDTYFNLSTGSVGTVAASHTASITPAGNGWYLCAVTEVTGLASTDYWNIGVAASDNSGPTAGTVGNGILIYGAQLEVAATPSSYIPTSGSTATRSADTITVPSANLPWPTPNVIGEELVTNGTFDSGDFTGFSASTGWTIVGGGANLNSNNGLFILTPSMTPPASNPSILTFDVTQYSAAPLTVRGNGPAFPILAVIDALGSYSVVLAPGVTPSFIRQSAVTNTTIDNISVREIDPLSVSIQMDGTVTGNTYTPTRWYLNASNAILQDIGSTDFTFTQEAANVVDTVTGGSFTSGVNTPFNIASRHGSTFINGSVDGTALTANTTPTALPDLSSTDLNLAFDYMGTVKTLRIWDVDLGDAGIAEAST